MRSAFAPSPAPSPSVLSPSVSSPSVSPTSMSPVSASPKLAVLTTAFALALIVLLSLSPLGSNAVRADSLSAAPTVEHTPEDVVRIVVAALRANGSGTDDAGIATVFRFASPGNKANTGPLERFTRMIKRGFGDMLGHVGSRFDEMRVIDDKALQAVWLTTPSGTEVGYAFQLGRQSGGEFDGMWMTESVLPLGESERSGTRI